MSEVAAARTGCAYPSRRPRLAPWALALLAGSLALAARASQPTLRTITVNGDLTDWEVVLANAVNVSADGDGSSLPSPGDCSQSSDRDCPVSSAADDLARFAWTYDLPNGMYFYFERYAASAVAKDYWIALDVDSDGQMTASDRLVRFTLNASTRGVNRTVFPYVPAGATGQDPIVDAGGFGDGYRIPGTAGTTPIDGPTAEVTAANAARTAFEQFVPWSDIATPGKAAGLHPASTDAGAGINTAHDNVGGPDRGKLSTLWTDISMDPCVVVTAAPGRTVDIPHSVPVNGNSFDVLDIRVVSSQTMPIEIWADMNHDGVADPGGPIAQDAEGDGYYLGPSDTPPVPPTWDSNGNGFPDEGGSSAGQTMSFVVRVLLPAAPATVDAYLTVDVHATYDTTAEATCVDRVVSGDLALTPNHVLGVAPNVQLSFAHTVENHLPSPLRVDLGLVSSNGWTYALLTDPNGDGNPSDGAPITNTAGSPAPDMAVPANGVAHFVAQTLVPGATPLGTLETLNITATATTGSPQAVATDMATVAPETVLTPDHTRALGTNGFVGPGQAILYRHLLTNNSASVQNYSLTATSSLGWASRFFSDPDGDGNPADGQDLGSAPRLTGVPPYGGTVGLVLELVALAGAPLNAVDTTQVSAFEEAGSGTVGRATDESIVSQLATFSDAAHLVQATHFAACDTVYAQAYGLQASLANGYQFSWLDPSATPARVQVFTSDASGQGQDSFTLPSGASGQYQVVLSKLGSGSPTVLDTQPIDLEGGLVADSITTDRGTYAQTGDDLTVSFTLRNPDMFTTLYGFNVQVIVLDPTGSMYLDPASGFQPYSGSQLTHSYPLAQLGPGASWTQQFTQTSVSYPSQGTYSVMLRWKNTCQSLSDRSSATFAVGGACSGAALTEVAGVRVRKSGADVALSWTDMAPLEPCVTYSIFRYDAPVAGRVPSQLAPWVEAPTGLATTSWSDSNVLGNGHFDCYLVRAHSPSHANGLLDAAYGQ